MTAPQYRIERERMLKEFEVAQKKVDDLNFLINRLEADYKKTTPHFCYECAEEIVWNGSGWTSTKCTCGAFHP